MQEEKKSKTQCAYCGSDGPQTREHLWPAKLHRRNLAANQQKKSLFWLRRIDQEIEGEPTIRDVCAKCNNGVLSNLDTNICNLFDYYFLKTLQYGEKVTFSFDYHKLKRWLLKMSHHSARVHSSWDTFAFLPLLPYIMGESEICGRSVQLFVQLSFPGIVPRDRLTEPELQDAPFIWEPTDLRCGHAAFYDGNGGRRALRVVHLRSYSFYLALYQPDAPTSEMNRSAKILSQTLPGSKLLLPSRPRVELVCDGVDAWGSVESARANRFIQADRVEEL